MSKDIKAFYIEYGKGYLEEKHDERCFLYPENSFDFDRRKIGNEKIRIPYVSFWYRTYCDEYEVRVIIWNEIVYQKKFSSAFELSYENFNTVVKNILEEHKEEFTVEGANKKIYEYLELNGISRSSFLAVSEYYRDIDDKKNEFHWFKKAVSIANVPRDIRCIARKYKFGQGCKKNLKLSQKLYDKADIYKKGDQNF